MSVAKSNLTNEKKCLGKKLLRQSLTIVVFDHKIVKKFSYEVLTLLELESHSLLLQFVSFMFGR